jgi:phospholipid/cholesterol/gamma-HCH transport system substrate-binding protein
VERERLARSAVTAALVLVVLVVAVILFAGGGGHTLYAEFTDAGQLVNGDLVTVAGHQVGSVGSISLTPDGLAKVKMSIDDSIWPIHEGTRAEIRQLSLTGVANRFIGLSLVDTGPTIGEGGTIGVQDTKGIVDLDVFLDTLTPQVRRSLSQIIKTGAYTFSGPTPKQTNQGLRYFNPALSQTTELGRQVVADRYALERLLSSTADVATALNNRSSDLTGAVTSTAAWLREVASQRAALQDQLVRAPGVLGQARAVLADTSYALGVLNPMLRDLQPVAPKLAGFLAHVSPAVHGLVPTIRGVQALVAPAESALTGFRTTERKATPAVNGLPAALVPVTPILAGLRPYVPDQVQGFFTGVGGNTGGYYDANGHYARIAPIIAPGGSSLAGLLGLLGNPLAVLPNLSGGYKGKIAPCPGGGGPPSADGSMPWTSPDTLPATGTLCNPADDQQ